jgi:cation diffusion facilitator CzcD-associated flavoprotein CzcO
LDSSPIPYPTSPKRSHQLISTPGGLHYWLGTWRDVLSDPTINAEAYAFWRSKTLPRISSPRNQRLLCPETPHDPFGTKRISLEQGYFETFNRDTVELVSTRENDIERFTERGIVTADGLEREFDVVCLACGFDSITGGITQIEIRGREGGTVEEKWRGGVYTFLGMVSCFHLSSVF